MAISFFGKAATLLSNARSGAPTMFTRLASTDEEEKLGNPPAPSRSTRISGLKRLLTSLRARLRVVSRRTSGLLAAFLLVVCLIGFLYTTREYERRRPPAPFTSNINQPYSILILQQIIDIDPNAIDTKPSYITNRPELYEASIESHKRYAAVWEYGYKRTDRDWAKEIGLSPHLNKLYSLANEIELELAKGQNGAEWIMITDADTLIYNPSIALEYLLPPPPGVPVHLPDGTPGTESLDPPPLILVNQDGQGFNAGVMLFRVDHRSLDFLRAMFALEPELVKLLPAATLHPEDLAIVDGIEHPSDQFLFGWCIQRPEFADVARALYEIPAKWVNSYNYEHSEGSQMWQGVSWTPEIQIHLVNRGWGFRHPWETYIVLHANEMYKQVLEEHKEASGEVLEGTEAAIVRKTFWEMPAREQSLYAARRWWATARGGVNHMTWPDF